jgi:hypothetical protein
MDDVEEGSAQDNRWEPQSGTDGTDVPRQYKYKYKYKYKNDNEKGD